VKLLLLLLLLAPQATRVDLSADRQWIDDPPSSPEFITRSGCEQSSLRTVASPPDALAAQSLGNNSCDVAGTVLSRDLPVPSCSGSNERRLAVNSV